MTEPVSAGKGKPVGGFSLEVEQLDAFEFRVRFDDPNFADLLVDEAVPLGRGVGPNPARILAASIASCLSASLLFCLTKAGVSASGLSTKIDAELVRNERGRLRVGRFLVRLQPRVEPGPQLSRCLEVFEDFCVVTESVRRGIPVEVTVQPVRPTALPGEPTYSEDAPSG
jgi:uncharacterized OsmC-like protein